MEQLYGPKKDWSRDDLARLFAMSKPNMRTVLSYVAKHSPNRRVSLPELSGILFEEGTDPNLNRISGTFNGLTRNSQHIRGRDSGVWPIFYEPHGKSGYFEYWMDLATAQQFREIARSFQG